MRTAGLTVQLTLRPAEAADGSALRPAGDEVHLELRPVQQSDLVSRVETCGVGESLRDTVVGGRQGEAKKDSIKGEIITTPIIDPARKPPLCHKDTAKGKKCPLVRVP